MKKVILFFVSIFSLSLFFSKQALAVCPVCVVAVGAGLELSHYLGIDDSISGLWFGGLIVSIIFWTESWLDKKKIQIKGRLLITAVLYYALTLLPLYYYGIIDKPGQNDCFCGLDKLLFGIIFGSIFFYLGAKLYPYLKAKNNGKSYFPFQKVAMPIIPLIILSIIFYFLIKYNIIN